MAHRFAMTQSALKPVFGRRHNRQQSRLFTSLFVLSTIVLLTGTAAYAVDAPQPSTGGALPQFYIPYSIQYGSYAPAINLEPATINAIPHDVLISKPLVEAFETQAQAGKAFTVTSVKAEQTHPMLTPKDLEHSTQGLINTPLDIKALQLAGGGLSNRCLKAGWVCQSQVNLSDDNTALHIKLTPVRVKSLVIEEGKYVKKRALKHQLHVPIGEPLRLTRLQHQLQWINDNPDTPVEASLSNVDYSPENPETTVTINISEDKYPLHVGTFFNNIGINQNGLYFYGGGAVHNNILGFGDTLGVTGVGTNRGSWGIFSHYEVPVNSHGTRLYAEYGFVDAPPRTWGFEDFNYNVARASQVSVGVKQVLKQWEHTRLSADLNFDAKQAKTHDDGADLELEYIRQLRLGVQVDRDDSSGNTSFRNEVAWGLDVLGASLGPDPRISVGDSQYSRWTGTLTRSQQLPWGTDAIISISGQLSPDHLSSTEILGAGGTLATRGYREGLYLGDNGIFVSAQWNIPAFFIPKDWKLPRTDISLRDNIQLVTFVDYAFLHQNRQGPGGDPDEHVLGVGVGIRAQLSKYFDLRFDIAQPVFRQDGFGSATRFHFGLNSTIL
jgi:hemolysin activation/secretion protein